MAAFRSTFAHSNYTVRGYSDTNPKEVGIFDQDLMRTCQALLFIFKDTDRMDPEMHNLEKLKLNSLPLRERLRNYNPPHEPYPIKAVKAMYGIPLTMESTEMTFRFFPQFEGTVTVVDKQTSGGCRYRVYDADETVFFKGESMQGSFQKRSEGLKKITTTFSTASELTSLLSAIAIYLRHGWEFNGARTLKQVKKDTVDSVNRTPHAIVRCTAAEMAKVVKEKKGNVGCLEVFSGAEFRKPEPTQFEFRRGFLLSKTHRGIIIKPDSDPKCVYFPRTVSCPLVIKFIGQQDPQWSLLNTIAYHKLRKNIFVDIVRENWLTDNSHLIKWLDPVKVDSIANTVRTLLKRFVNKDTKSYKDKIGLVSFFYCFAYSNYSKTHVSLKPLVAEFKYADEMIYLNLNAGIAVLGEEKGLLVYNHDISRSLQPQGIVREMITGILADFRLLEYTAEHRDLPIKTVEKLREDSDHIHEDQMFKFILGGKWMVVKKSKMDRFRVKATIDKHKKDMKRKLEEVGLPSILEQVFAGPAEKVRKKSESDGTI